MRYDNFAYICKQNKDMGVQPVGRIIDFKGQICILEVMGNRSQMLVKTLVDNVAYDGIGTVTNPSKIKNWTGWD